MSICDYKMEKCFFAVPNICIIFTMWVDKDVSNTNQIYQKHNIASIFGSFWGHMKNQSEKASSVPK
jgi:hypothetical protein